MRIVSLNKVEEGMKLGRHVFTEEGKILLNKDVILTKNYIEKLRIKNIPCIYVIDEDSEDIEVIETIDMKLKLNAIKTIRTMMDEIVKINRSASTKPNIGLPKDSAIKAKLVVNDILDDLKRAKNDNVLIRMVETMSTDMATFSKSVDMAMLSMTIGLDLEMKQSNIQDMGFGALLSDIGITQLPNNLLRKKETEMTLAELQEYKRHPFYGHNLLKSDPTISHITRATVLLHHENADGTGYLNILKDNNFENVNIYSKIMRISDMYCSLTSERSPVGKLPPYQALEYISMECTNGIIDEEIYHSLKKRLALYPEGTEVILSNNEIGIVTKNNENDSTRPIVKITLNPDGSKIQKFKVTDLSKDLTLFVKGTI